MLQLRLAPARKVLGAAIRGEASGIPKSNWRLHTELVLEGRQSYLHWNLLSLTCFSRLISFSSPIICSISAIV